MVVMWILTSCASCILGTDMDSTAVGTRMVTAVGTRQLTGWGRWGPRAIYDRVDSVPALQATVGQQPTLNEMRPSPIRPPRYTDRPSPVNNILQLVYSSCTPFNRKHDRRILGRGRHGHLIG